MLKSQRNQVFFLSLLLSWFFFQFHHLIFDWFGIRLHIFFLFSMRLSHSLLDHMFGGLTQVDLGLFLIFFNWLFFQFHLLTLDWLRIELHNLFWFSFYGVILVTWSRLQLWQINSSCLFFGLFLIDFPFQFHPSILV